MLDYIVTLKNNFKKLEQTTKNLTLKYFFAINKKM